MYISFSRVSMVLFVAFTSVSALPVSHSSAPGEIRSRFIEAEVLAEAAEWEEMAKHFVAHGIEIHSKVYPGSSQSQSQGQGQSNTLATDNSPPPHNAQIHPEKSPSKMESDSGSLASSLAGLLKRPLEATEVDESRAHPVQGVDRLN